MSQAIYKPARKLAAIDVGSNSIKLLAAECSAADCFEELATDRITVRLQKGLTGNTLSEDALTRAEDAILALTEKARQAGAERIEAFGTSALRDADNGGDLVARVRRRCGIPLTIVSGEEEALGAFWAAAPEGNAIVVNSGGGSTEMVRGVNGKPKAARSAHTGAVALMEEMRAAGAIGSTQTAQTTDTDSGVQAIRAARAHIAPEYALLGAQPGEPAVFSGGSATCAASVLLGLTEYDPKAVEGFTLLREQARALMERLFSMTPEQRASIPGMQPQRADILPFGLAILTAFFELSGLTQARVTSRSNLVGFLLKMNAEG